MRYKELPSSLQLRLLTFYHYRNKKAFERNQKILEEVSPYLREEIILHNYLKFLQNVELFKHLPKKYNNTVNKCVTIRNLYSW